MADVPVVLFSEDPDQCPGCARPKSAGDHDGCLDRAMDRTAEAKGWGRRSRGGR